MEISYRSIVFIWKQCSHLWRLKWKSTVLVLNLRLNITGTVRSSESWKVFHTCIMLMSYILHFLGEIRRPLLIKLDYGWCILVVQNNCFGTIETSPARIHVYGAHSKWISLISAPDFLLMPSSISFLVFRFSVRVLFHLVQTVAMTSSWCWTHTEIFVAHFEETNGSPPWCWLFINDSSESESRVNMLGRQDRPSFCWWSAQSDWRPSRSSLVTRGFGWMCYSC